MSNAATYRVRAAECDAFARKEISPLLREQWHAMGASYRLLAEQAEKNALTDIVYEPPYRPEHEMREQARQQQQARPRTKNEP